MNAMCARTGLLGRRNPVNLKGKGLCRLRGYPVQELALVASNGPERAGAWRRYCGLTRKWTRRFLAQHASVRSAHAGSSSPWLTMVIRLGWTP